MNPFKHLQLFRDKQRVCKINPINTEKFNLRNGKTYAAKVVRIIDGDTLVCIFKPFLSSGYYQFTIRLLNYDAPETRTLNPEEKARGLLAKSYLIHILSRVKCIYILCSEFDAFGRILGHVFLDPQRTEYVNEKMIDFLKHSVSI